MKQLMVSALLTALLGVNGLVLATEAKHEHDATTATASATIAATGTVKSVDAAKGKLVIDHDPIPVLKWPGMVMDFQLADPSMVGKVKAGDQIKFELKEGAKGAYLITVIEPAHAH